jgi:outer membrane protein
MHLERIMARWAFPTLAILLIVGLAAARPQPGAQPQQGGVRVAYVNAQIILQQMPGYAQAESTLSKEMAGYQNEMKKMSDQLDSTIAAYQQRAIALSAAEKKVKEDQIRQMQSNAAQHQNELRQRAQDRQSELLQPLEDRVKAVIEGLRAERNIGIVFDASPGSGIITADPALDLTSLVVQRLKAPQQ